MSNIRLFITQKIPNEGLAILEQNKIHFDTWSSKQRPTKEELVKLANKVEGLITMVTDPIDHDFLQQCQHLKIISQYGVGLNNIDLDAANKFGIKVTNTPDVLTDATAELTIALIMATARNFKPAILDIIHHKFEAWAPCDYRGKQLRGKTLGIFGKGRIGSRVAEIAELGLGMKVIFHSRSASQVSFEELLKQSDVVSVHCDLNQNTEGIFKTKAFELMKNDALFINTARGAVHNSEDLYDALINKKIMAAGLDVTDPEPLPLNHKAHHIPNLLVLPHIGSATFDARRKMAEMAAQNICDAFSIS